MKWRFYINGAEVQEPIGWDSIEFTTKRLESHGMDQPFSTELSFTGKDAMILKKIYDQSFINETTTFVITSNVYVEGQSYDFNGFVNFAIWTEEKTCDVSGWKVTVGIQESNFKEVFLSRQDVEVDLLAEVDLDNNAIPSLTLDTVRLHCQELFLNATARNYSDQISPLFYTTGGGWRLDDFAAILPLYYENTDFKGSFGNTFDPTQTRYTTFSPSFVNNSQFARNIRFNLSASGKFACGTGFFAGTSCNIMFSIQVLNGSSVETQRLYLYDSPINFWDNHNDTAWSFNVDYTLTLQPDDRVLLFMQWGGLGTYPVGISSPGVSIRIAYECNQACMTVSEFNSGADASLCNGLYVFNYLNRLLYIMTGRSDALISDFFDLNNGCQWNNLLTIGLYIRNAATVDDVTNSCSSTDPVAKYSMKQTFKKLFESLDRIFCLGWTFEQDAYGTYRIRIEPREYFYNNQIQIAEFSKVSDIRQFAMSDKLVNNIRLGYSDKWKNIAVSGIFEIHTDRNYFVPNKARADNSSSILDIRSDIIASGYAIEFMRRLPTLRDDSGSSDRPNDYDTFIIWLNADVVSFDNIEGSGYQLPEETGPVSFLSGTVSYGSNFIAESNSPMSRIYNVLHTPARIAANWWKWIGMNTYGLPVEKAKLFFKAGQYYTTYSSRIDATSAPLECLVIEPDVVLSESDNIEPTILTEANKTYLIKPMGIEMKAPQSLCDFILMANAQTGFVKINSAGQTFYGFIKDAGNQPENPKSGMTSLTLYVSNQNPVLRAFSDGFSDGFS